MNQTKKHTGTITIELLTAIFLLIVITAALMASLEFHGHCNQVQWARQRCVSAAQAQLDSIMMQKSELSQEDLHRLWPGVKCTVAKQPGQVSWQGLNLYTVTATVKVHRRTVSIELKRYISAGE